MSIQNFEIKDKKNNIDKNDNAGESKVDNTGKIVDLSKIPDSVFFQKNRIPKNFKWLAILIVFCFIIIGICVGIIIGSTIIRFAKV